jgi:hypothetical protein
MIPPEVRDPGQERRVARAGDGEDGVQERVRRLTFGGLKHPAQRGVRIRLKRRHEHHRVAVAKLIDPAPHSDLAIVRRAARGGAHVDLGESNVRGSRGDCLRQHRRRVFRAGHEDDHSRHDFTLRDPQSPTLCEPSPSSP